MGAVVCGIAMVSFGTYWLVMPHVFDRAYDSSMKVNPFLRRDGCGYELNRVIARYLVLPAFVVGGLVAIGIGLAGC